MVYLIWGIVGASCCDWGDMVLFELIIFCFDPVVLQSQGHEPGLFPALTGLSQMFSDYGNVPLRVAQARDSPDNVTCLSRGYRGGNRDDPRAVPGGNPDDHCGDQL